MYHPCSAKFQPSFFTESTFFTVLQFPCPMTDATGNVCLKRWLSKLEMVGTYSGLSVFVKPGFHKIIKCPFEMSNGNIFSNNKCFKLMENGCMGNINLPPVGLGDIKHFNWKFTFLHLPDLSG